MRPPSKLPSLDQLRTGIEAGARKLSIPLPQPSQLSALAAHLRLLYVWNPRVNLTAIRDPAEGVRRHALESIEAQPFLPDEGLLADLGSGNGYPALPCLTLRESLRGVLFESVARKVDFLRAAIRESRLGERVQATQTRVSGANSLPDGVSVVSMRGFPSPGDWCLRAFESQSVQRVLAWVSREDALQIAENAEAAGLPALIHPLKSHPTGALLVLSRR